jgi:hypothetical protein
MANDPKQTSANTPRGNAVFFLKNMFIRCRFFSTDAAQLGL